ncbi:hypothetical protein VV01_18800 [Luteipulveratus halotolerans]|uniref:Uncharacterized protein n=1 Tax=Luteipulveratus halotolerans TaxID=1631356 RepID=A0A0L6CLW5_9MICO|nr:hypothetical protein VV01_18800 [Luteipulveratus halotolerans]
MLRPAGACPATCAPRVAPSHRWCAVLGSHRTSPSSAARRARSVDDYSRSRCCTYLARGRRPGSRPRRASNER